jgi:catechol 2,3-dioxygenase-like lactoylglutathione lyase family enzyme
MAKVLGVGGVFFKAADPAAVGAWYARVLGFEVSDWGGVAFKPSRIGTNWAPFAADTSISRRPAPFMINFIVDDIDGVLAKAAAEGVEPRAAGRAAWGVSPG